MAKKNAREQKQFGKFFFSLYLTIGANLLYRIMAKWEILLAVDKAGENIKEALLARV